MIRLFRENERSANAKKRKYIFLYDETVEAYHESAIRRFTGKQIIRKSRIALIPHT